MTEPNLSRLPILPMLPSRFGHNIDLPDGLEGAQIVGIGTFANPLLVSGGGLVIDFLPKGSATVSRIVLGLNELGIWVEWGPEQVSGDVG